MSGSRQKRLAKLERKRRPAERGVLLWYDAARETAEQATARRFPEGVPPGVRLHIFRWLTKGESVPGDRARPRP
jgi:hypothetical protein